MIQNEQGLNSHVEKYLDYYCNLPHPPGFTILLKGQWGCGKTWFIKKYYEKLNQTKEKNILYQSVPIVWRKFCKWIRRKPQQIYKGNRCLYISLNGLNSIADIDESIYQQLHPFWSSEQVKAVGIVIKTLLKGSLKIDLTNDGKDRAIWNIQIPDIPNNFEYSELKNVDKRVLIFDDLERCKIDLSNLLGYINSFVEHQGLKVILIANEDELQENANYKSIKEKLIGKTFNISFDLEGSLKYLIDKLNNTYVTKFLFDNTDLIQDLYQQAEYKNLRTLKLVVLDFEKIFDAFDDHLQEKVKNKPAILQEVLRILIAFSIEIKCGILLPKDINKLLDEYLSRPYKSSSPQFNRFENRLPDLIIKDNNEELSPLQKILNKYGSLILYEPFLGSIWWTDFFDRGIINAEELKKSILNSKYFQDENTPNWMRLFYFVELSDDNFNSLINEVELKYKNREYNEIGVIKHIHGLFLHFFEIGLYHKSKEEILEDSKRYIDHLKESNSLSLTYFGFEDIYNGLTFQGQDSEEFKQLSLYIKQVQELIQQENIPKNAQDLLDTIKTNSYKFYRSTCEDIADIDQDEYTSIQKYYDIPILKYMEPDTFVENLLSTKGEDQHCIFSALKQRYKSDNINEMLIEELTWLKSVQALLQMEVDKRKGKLSGYKLRRLIKEYLNGSIEKLELKQSQIQAN